MISGTVNARLEAVIRLRVRGPGGTELDFAAVIDTGFTSSLTLPATAVTALGLVRQSGGSVVLGDGSVAVAASLGQGEAYLLRRVAARHARPAAIEVLEAIGSSEARSALARLAKGLPEAQQTREARQALGRLTARD